MQITTSDKVHTFSRSAVEWALSCTAWRTFEEHIDQLRAQHGSDHEVLETLLLVVPQIVDAGLLRIRYERARMESQDFPPHPDSTFSIAAIGFPTGGVQGLELVPRAVRSFSENLDVYNRNADLSSAIRPWMQHCVRNIAPHPGTERGTRPAGAVSGIRGEAAVCE